ncbi:hypothetical protein EPN27_01810 [Patescibacteria group bacterium]|nr:MAG: hypothetical protein EPN27_01810 [Patescibacteria group bacterium]
MNELHKGQYDASKFEPNEGQRGLLCSNKASLRCPSLSSSSTLSKDTLSALEELGDVLKSIRKRMYTEGYEIVDGVVRKAVTV